MVFKVGQIKLVNVPVLEVRNNARRCEKKLLRQWGY